MTRSYRLIKESGELEELAKTIFENHNLIAVDTEGDLDFWNGSLVLLQIGLPDEDVLIDIRAFSDLTPIKAVLESPKITKILQNAKFDYKALKYHCGIVLNNIYDTMLAEQLLLAGRSTRGDFALESLAKKYTDVSLAKHLRIKFADNPPFFTQDMLRYAADDVYVLRTIYYEQLSLLAEERLNDIAELEFRLMPVVAEVELAGVLIDLAKWKEFTQWLIDQRSFYSSEIYKAAADKVPQLAMFDDVPIINLNSWQQVLRLLNAFGLHPPNTRAETLKNYDHQVAQDIVQYKTYQKLVGSFGEPIPGFIKEQTGRIHASFQQIGAQSGRFSCREPNLQQIPIKDTTGFRECFIAPEGKKLITADYSQIEMQIIAEWGQDEGLIHAFNSGEDVHRWVASKLFNKDLADISKKERDAAKNMAYGMSYGMSAAGFSRRAGISKQEAQSLIDVFFGQFSAASKWLDNAGRATLKSGFSKSMWGRKRWFEIPRYNDPNYNYIIAKIEREGRNHAVQGTSCDMLKSAMVTLFQDLRSYDARIINCIHDELVIEVDEHIANDAANTVRNTMVAIGKKFLPSVDVNVGINIGDSWIK